MCFKIFIIIINTMRTMFLMDLLYLVRGGVVDMYFGDFATTMSTLMVCIATTYIIYTIIKQKQTEYWGRRIVLIALFGLIICCFVATRDSYNLSVQSIFDTTVSEGVFALNSI